MHRDDEAIMKGVFGVIFAILFFGTLFMSCEIVDPGHRGLVVKAGAVQNEILGEGFVMKMPFVTTIKEISIRIRQSEAKTAAASKDMQKVHATFSLNWHISPEKVKDVYQNIGDPKIIENTVIDKTVSEVLKAETAKMTAEEILSKRMELKENIDKILVERLAHFGLVVDAVNLADFDFEADFNKAVEEKQVAEQKAKKAVYDAQRATQEALAEIEKAKGQAEAQRLLKQSITQDLIQKLAVEKWNGQLPTTMVVGKDGTMPFLNLK